MKNLPIISGTAFGLGLLSILVYFLLNMDALQMPPADEELPWVKIYLGNNYELVQGDLEWPHLKSGEPSSLLIYEHPVLVVVHLPGGQGFQTSSRTLFAEQDEGVVGSVSLTPPVVLVDYREAIAEAERLAASLGIASDANIQEKINQWKQMEPVLESAPLLGEDKFYLPSKMPLARMKIKGAVVVELGVNSATNGGWYVQLNFYAPGYGLEMSHIDYSFGG